jgi:hypothetical protein
MTSTRNIIAPPYHVQSTAKELRNGFPYFDHHDTISSLWTKKWRPPCASGIYPFGEGNVLDVDPIFAELVLRSGDDPHLLYQPDEYARPFLAVGKRLASEAASAASRSRPDEAKNLYLRAAAVFRIARFPINRSKLGQEAWERGKAAYEQAGQLLNPQSVPISLPFTHAEVSAGDQDAPIQAYLRLPKGERPAKGWPVILFICGLDAVYRRAIGVHLAR